MWRRTRSFSTSWCGQTPQTICATSRVTSSKLPIRLIHDFLSECPSDLPGWMWSRMLCFCARVSTTSCAVKLLTNTLSSGKPSLTLRSHTSMGEPSPTSNQTRNRPTVSSEFNGTMETAVRVGGGNVRSNSVDTHVARCSLSTNLQIVCLWAAGRHTSDTNGSYLEVQTLKHTTYPIAKLDNGARVWERTWWYEEGRVEHLLLRG